MAVLAIVNFNDNENELEIWQYRYSAGYLPLLPHAMLEIIVVDSIYGGDYSEPR